MKGMVATAQLKGLRASPQKVRLVADLIRGKQVEEALNILLFTEKKSARPIEKLLRSAVANADQKNADIDSLYVGSVLVDGGQTLKRFRPRAMGRAAPILKRTSHVTIGLEQRS